MNILKSIYLSTIMTGGCSYSLQERKTIKKGFSVSIFPEYEKIVNASEFTTFTIDDYIDEHLKALTDYPGAIVGTWNDNGRIFLDVSIVVETYEEAEKLGKAHNQKAFYDLGKNETITIEKGA